MVMPNYQRKDLHTVQVYLIIEDVEECIHFLKEVFDGIAEKVIHRDDQSIMHAEIRIGDSIIMAGEPADQFDIMPASLFVYVKDCDSTFQKALDYGCEPIMQPETLTDSEDRYGGVQDKNGNIWWIATHLSND